MRIINESITVGFDINDDPTLSCAVVIRKDKKGNIEQIKIFYGQEANELHKILTN